MNSKSINYRFNISNLSEYNFFWITYDFLLISPSTELTIIKKGEKKSTLLNRKTNLNLSDILFVLKINEVTLIQPHYE